MTTKDTEPCPEWKDINIIGHELSTPYDNYDHILSGEDDNYFSEEYLENDKYNAKYTPDVEQVIVNRCNSSIRCKDEVADAPEGSADAPLDSASLRKAKYKIIVNLTTVTFTT